MQGTSKKHDLSPGDSQLPNKKLRIENPNGETSETPFNSSQNYLSKLSSSFNDPTSNLEKTYGSFRNRSSLSRPAGYAEKPVSERFGPYSMRPSRRQTAPMIIRAKRQIQEDADPHVTTTAQKIIETLARMSTPVANAQRVPIDSIKPLKPSFSNLRRNIDYGGPPILRSPLVPSSTKIVSSPVNNNLTLRSLPKLVDSATNTDHLTYPEMGTYDDSDKHSGGGKIRRNLNRIHAAPLKKPSVENNVCNSNDTEEKTNFKFGNSWAAEDVIEVMVSGLESIDDTEVSENAVKVAENSSDQKSPGNSASFKETLSRMWDCPSCLVQNKAEAHACVCCTEKKPPEGKGQLNLLTSTPKSATAVTLASKPLTSPLTRINKSQWTCPVCMVPNSNAAPTCVCCSEKNPNAKTDDMDLQSAPKVTSSFSSTSTTSTTGSTSSSSTTSQSQWTCPTCMVPNNKTAAACACCSEKNPNAQPVESASAVLPVPTFKFGISGISSTTSSFSTSTSTSTFTFGTPTASTPPIKTLEKEAPQPTTTTFTGAGAAKWNCPTCMVPNNSTASSCVCCNEKNPNSSSEPSTSATTISSDTPSFSFGFGVPKTMPTASTSSILASSTTETATVQSKITTAGTSADKKQPSSDTIRPVFGIPKLPEDSKQDKANIFAGFKFSAPSSTTSTSPTPVAAAAKVDMWRCDICPANNSENASHCIACDAKKPIKVNKEQQKKFSFAPFSGGRTVQTAPQISQSPKASIFGGVKPANELFNESPKQKRKHSDDTPDASFQYTAPEPKLKMKVVSDAVVTQPTEIKTGSFLDAIKPQSSGSLFGGTPNTLTSTAPISTTVTSVAAAPAPFVFGSAPAPAPSTPTFQFGAQIPSANPSFTFGSNNNEASKPPVTVFGSLPSSTHIAPPSAPSQPSLPVVPSFSMTPNLNFGVPTVPGLTSTTNAQTPLFQFQANPTPSDGSSGGGPRKIRKAMRRMK